MTPERGDPTHTKSSPAPPPASLPSPTAHSKAAGSTSRKPARRTPPPLSPLKANRIRRRIALNSQRRELLGQHRRPAWRSAPRHRTESFRERSFAVVIARISRSQIAAPHPQSTAPSVPWPSPRHLALRARPHRRRNSRTNSRPNSSRPAVFGGFARKNCLRSIASTTGSITFPDAAIFPPRSNACPNKASRHRIDHHVAGPGIEGEHLLGIGPRRNRRQIRDPSNVLHDAPDLRDREISK